MITIEIWNRVSDSSCALSLSIVLSSSVVLFYYDDFILRGLMISLYSPYMISHAGFQLRFLLMFIHSYFQRATDFILVFLAQIHNMEYIQFLLMFSFQVDLNSGENLRSAELLLNIVLMFCKLQIFWTFSVLVLRIWCYTSRAVVILKSVSNAYHLLLTCV